MHTIRAATEADFELMWPIFRRIVGAKNTYAFPPDYPKADTKSWWFCPGGRTFVALVENKVVGFYLLKANQMGVGDHVANAAYMVDPDSGGKGVGRAMGEHSLVEAKKAGFLAMQFNYVVSTNENAVALWKKLGFNVVGTVPKAYRHTTKGLVDILIMHRFL